MTLPLGPPAKIKNLDNDESCCGCGEIRVLMQGDGAGGMRCVAAVDRPVVHQGAKREVPV